MSNKNTSSAGNSLQHVLITGGAGFIGSMPTGELLRMGVKVTVVDDLIFGGESLLGFLAHPNFHFNTANVIDPRVIRSGLTSNPHDQRYRNAQFIVQ